MIGGTASAISGGKFANGAQTGAFQYLFNQASNREQRSNGIKDWFTENSLEYNLGVDVTMMLGKKGIQFGGYFGIGDDGISVTLLATDLKTDPSYMRQSWFLGAGGSTGGAAFDAYQDVGMLSGHTGTNRVITGGGGSYYSGGVTTTFSPSGISAGAARGGWGIGAYYAEGTQYYATGRLNW